VTFWLLLLINTLTYLLTYLRTRAILALPAQSRAVLPRHDELSHSALSVTWQLSVTRTSREKRDSWTQVYCVTDREVYVEQAQFITAGQPPWTGVSPRGDVFMGWSRAMMSPGHLWKQLILCVRTTRSITSLRSLHHNNTKKARKTQKKRNKNLVIVNRSRVSCAHKTLRASIGLNITPWPWNVG